MNTNFVVQFALIVCVGFSGCAGVGVNNTMRRSDKTSQWNPFVRLTEKEKAKKAKKETKPAESFVVIWKDSVLEKPGTPAVRGFGGRIHFFDADNAVVKTEGELVVYGFDDSDAADGTSNSESAKSTKPDRKFVFDADQLESHFSETEIGPSYSVWIPWEKKGGHRKVINLIPVFKTVDGRVLKCEPSQSVLPGKPPGTDLESDSQAANSSKTGVELAQFISDKAAGRSGVVHPELNEDEYNQTRMRTSTINLTPAMATRFSNSVPNVSTEKQTEVERPDGRSQWNQPPQSDSAVSDPMPADASESDLAPADTTTESKPKRQAVFGAPGAFR